MVPHLQPATAHAQVFDLREQLSEDVLQRVERSMGVRLDRTTLVHDTQGMTGRIPYRRWHVGTSAVATAVEDQQPDVGRGGVCVGVAECRQARLVPGGHLA